MFVKCLILAIFKFKIVHVGVLLTKITYLSVSLLVTMAAAVSLFKACFQSDSNC